jgi:hypothetical protein
MGIPHGMEGGINLARCSQLRRERIKTRSCSERRNATVSHRQKVNVGQNQSRRRSGPRPERCSMWRWSVA